jgi:hypothetical protein
MLTTTVVFCLKRPLWWNDYQIEKSIDQTLEQIVVVSKQTGLKLSDELLNWVTNQEPSRRIPVLQVKLLSEIKVINL